MEDNKYWLTFMLNENLKRNHIVELVGLTCSPVTGRAESEACDVSKIKMQVILGTGKLSKRSIIVKRIPYPEAKAKNLKKFTSLWKEMKVYTHVIPFMAELMDDVEDRNEPVWCKCIEHKPFERLVLEDLTDKGFRMVGQREGLDLAHATIAVKSLATFHALSFILHERNYYAPNEYPTLLLNTKDDLLQTFHNANLENVITTIETLWEAEWLPYAGKLKRLLDKSLKRLEPLLEVDARRFNVLNHGDLWFKNMMFSYSPDADEIPYFVKFIDFQSTQYNSYGMDLIFFLTTSINQEVRKTYTDDLIINYHKSLHFHLNKFGCYTRKAPTLEGVRSELDRLGLYGLIVGCTALAVMQGDPNNLPKLEDIFKEMEVNKDVKLSLQLHMGEPYTSTLKMILKSCVEKGVI